ncbi:acetyl-CoA carboxylase biotin carboxylase subunit family protein [Streptosporangium sp. NPDC049376]|uniref:acetyl-CoA carboxylase biotin carboxylase subunit family protein n=1 Tax=Streptosporangium sp. NPDC049376 TaxID=3366192 RepID=UPI0037A2A592
MKILVVHQVPYRKIDYHLAIDHEVHDVTYVGRAERIAELPEGLRCRRLEVGPADDLAGWIIENVSPAEGFEQLLSLSEDGVLLAWRVRRHLGIEGPSLDRLRRVRDKVSMKEALEGSGVRHPRFVAADAVPASLPWSGRTVLKPRQGASSQEVVIHETAEAALAACRALGDPGGFELEEYVDGDVLHADGLVQDGELVDVVFSRCVRTPLDFAQGTPIASHQIQHDERHRVFAERVLRALEIDTGCVHLEFFETKEQELVFLEVANRLGGAGIVTSHLRHTGVHLPSHEIAIRLGWPRPRPRPASGRYHGFAIFPGHHLKPAEGYTVDVPDHIRNHPWVDKVHSLDGRQPLPDHISYQEWEIPVFIEASHPDPGVLRQILGEFVLAPLVRPGGPPVRPGSPSTEPKGPPVRSEGPLVRPEGVR